MIPKIVHYTYKTHNFPHCVQEAIDHNKRINKDYEFRFYDDNACDKFIKDNFDERTYKAYNSINSTYGAMKADVFRYCVLQKIGGVYMDAKSVTNKSFSEIIKPEDTCILDILRIDHVQEKYRKQLGGSYEQWILMFAPNHPYIKAILDQCINDIDRRYIPTVPGYNARLNQKQKVLLLTGPDAFARAIRNYLKAGNKQEHRHIDYFKFFLHNRPGCNYKKMYSMNGSKHYSESTDSIYK